MIVMLSIGLGYQKPSTANYYEVKLEMERLAFIGDSAINLSVAIYQILGGNKGKNEQELSQEKAMMINQKNIEDKCQRSGLQNLML